MWQPWGKLEAWRRLKYGSHGGSSRLGEGEERGGVGCGWLTGD